MKDFLDYLLKTWNCSSYKIGEYGIIFFANRIESFYLRYYPSEEAVSFEDNSYEDFYEKNKDKTFYVLNCKYKHIKTPDIIEMTIFKSLL